MVLALGGNTRARGIIGRGNQGKVESEEGESGGGEILVVFSSMDTREKENPGR